MQQRLECSVPCRVVERLLEERGRALSSLELGEEEEGLGARRPRRRDGKKLVRECPRARSLSGSEVRASGGERAPMAILGRARGRRRQGMLPELRCGDRSAASDRYAGRRLELGGELGVRLLRRQRPMAGARERIVDDLGQALVRAAPIARRGGLIEHGCEQRVRKTDDPVRELDHVVGEPGLEYVAVELCGPQPPVRAGKQQRSTRLVRQSVEAGADERLQRLRDAQRLGRVDVLAQGTPELERKEGISARDLVDAQQRRPRERPAEPRLQDPVQRAGTERADVLALDRFAVERKLELGSVGATPEPAGEKQPDVLALQAPQRELQGGSRRSVQPLDIVDREQDRLTLGEQVQRATDGHGQRSEVDRRARLLAEQQRGLERTPTGRFELVDHFPEYVFEQVSQPGVFDPQLDLGGARRQDAKPAVSRSLDTGEPDRRLPDPRLALQDQPRHARAGRPVEEGMDRAELVVPAEQIHDDLLQPRA